MKFINTPKDQYITRIKSEGMTYSRTSIHCPLCRSIFPKRSFEDHVYQEHSARADECFAMLFGIPFPTRCSCGHDIHYVRGKGFPVQCPNCATGTFSTPEYKDVNDANLHIHQLEEMLANAKNEAKRLKKQAEVDKIPLDKLPFPSRKNPIFLMKLSKLMRVAAVNGDQKQIFDLANIVDSFIKGA